MPSLLDAHRESASTDNRMQKKPTFHQDIEKVSQQRQLIPYFRFLLDQGFVDLAVINYQYAGSGSEEHPFHVGWIDSDPRNPLLFSNARKWVWVAIESIATLAVALTTSVYSVDPAEVMGRFGISRELYKFGFSGLYSVILYTECKFLIDLSDSVRAWIRVRALALGASK